MTLIIALRGANGPAIMASDSYIGEDTSTVHDLLASPKIAKVCKGEAMIGLAGNPTSFWEAVRALEKLDLKGFDMRSQLRPYMVEQEIVKDSDDFSAVLIHGRDIWCIDSSWTPFPLLRDYTACGVGRDFAMGMLAYAFRTSSLSRHPARIARNVMKDTAQHVSNIVKPFDFSDDLERK